MLKSNKFGKRLARHGLCFFAGLFGPFLFVGCQPAADPKPAGVAATGVQPSIVTADIQEGIERHIDEQVRSGGGYFHVPFEGDELKLKLVRVHTEYLATLGPTRHFACVDMVTEDGEFYDVDFFMEGPRGEFKVTETTIHKKNGKPFYVWKQAADKTWGRVPIDQATNETLGVIYGRDRFSFRYAAPIPQIQQGGRMWLPLAASDAFQTVKIASVTAPVPYKILVDPEHNNQALFFALAPEHSGKEIVIVYDVERLEKGAYPGNPQDAARHLDPHLKGPTWDKIQATAEEAVRGKEAGLMRARALYDHVMDTMAYKRCGKGWGTGDVKRICDLFSGNCTDFHSYFIALAKAVGIPARFAIGAAIPSERNDGGVEGYHCWAEFFVEGKWWPIDVSEADKYSGLAAYYFGHHPANRFEFSRGRDLVFEPGPDSGPINFLAYPVLEIDGKPVKAKTEFSFERSISKTQGPISGNFNS